MANRSRFAILVYEGVEPIDVGATHGVLSMARRVVPEIAMFLVAEQAGPVRLANGLTVHADCGYEDCPAHEILMICGGPGWPHQAANRATVDFIRRQAAARATVASVCTGALILAATGLLDGHRATTKRHVIGEERSPLQVLRERHPAVEVVESRWVDEGRIITGGGVTLAIDTTLHLIERIYGIRAASETARIIEYQAAWLANRDAFKATVATDRQGAASHS
jgi:transcriptional regulator GlxA family with amidase domain